MNDCLDVQQNLELFERLKSTVEKFSQREEKTTRDLLSRKALANRALQAAQEQAGAGLDEQTAQIHEHVNQKREEITRFYQKRAERIEKAKASLLRIIPQRAQQERDRYRGELQMQIFHLKKELPESLAQAGADYVEVGESLKSLTMTLRAVLQDTRKAIWGCGVYRWKLRNNGAKRFPIDPNTTPRDLLKQMQACCEVAQNELVKFRAFSLPRFFSYIPLPLWFLMLAGLVFNNGYFTGFKSIPSVVTDIVAGLVFITVWIIHSYGISQSRAVGIALVNALVQARYIGRYLQAVLPEMAQQRAALREQITAENKQKFQQIEQQWDLAPRIASQYDMKARSKMEAQLARIHERFERTKQSKLSELDAHCTQWLDQLERDSNIALNEATLDAQNTLQSLNDEEERVWPELEAQWQREMTPLYQEVDKRNREAAALIHPWDHTFVENWKPADTFVSGIPIGRFEKNLALPGLPSHSRLSLPGPALVSLPIGLSFPNRASIMVETSQTAAGSGQFLNSVILKLLAAMPPGKVAFTLIDPVGLGENFAGLMHLADYEEALINSKIWTQHDQIETKLEELSDQIEKVIQMYLRNEYPTITDYNRQAGIISEKYRFLVVADFPAAFSETAVKRLQSIAMSGPRCGIFTFMQRDLRQKVPDGFFPDQLRQNSLTIRQQDQAFIVDKQQIALGVSLKLDGAPEPDLAVELINKIGKASIDSIRVQVPFSHISPHAGEEWTGDTTSELKIAIGRTGATKFQYLAIGKGTRQHALFAGKTGSGKSTLFHVIITNLALTCSPDQVEFYLIDFKKGVEFKCYASKQLPHARVVAIESDREFALSVLQRVDDELKRRGDIFRKLGVQDLAGYRRAGGQEALPRSILLIDEFQEFFVDDDAVAQTASLLFDRIVRQGRAFGIHVLLGSQTLGGSYSLARTTLGQMVIRVALQCNEADAYLIMDENNPAPRLLSRPGEGIYNDAAGAIEGNSPFQVVWLPDDERDDILVHINEMAAKSGKTWKKPIVFEGNVPSDVRQNPYFDQLKLPTSRPARGRCWMGSPNSIKGPTEVVFQRQNGSHLLLAGQRGEAVQAMLGLAIVSLAKQFPVGTARFVVLNNAGGFIDDVTALIPHEVVSIKGNDVGASIHDLALDLKQRSESGADSSPTTFLIINGMQKYKRLRFEDEFSFSSADDEPNPGAEFNQLLTEGSASGIHILTWLDTLNNVNRFLNRKALAEFTMRIVFQMSANDSASLIDSPSASNLGLHRAIYFNEQEGALETFRPYAIPEPGWLEKTLGVELTEQAS